MTALVNHAQNKDAVNFKQALTAAIQAKVGETLEAAKIAVAKTFFNSPYSTTVEEETTNGAVEALEPLDEKLVVPGSVEHMRHHVYNVHTGALPEHGNIMDPAKDYHTHYHVHKTGTQVADRMTTPGHPSTHIYHVIHKASGEVHKFHVTHTKDGLDVNHVGMVSK